ncbi:hypothetical protein NQZ68_026921 [Dissostichus eleginoides]|nr:hypothetical protein NQZ68_026921 [Dissostichus eleginoides]
MEEQAGSLKMGFESPVPLFSPAPEALRGIPLPGGMNGSCSGGGSVPSSLSGQQLISSSIPSPTKSWRSKSMNLKHSATSSMLSSPTLSPSEAPEALHDGSKVGGGGHHQRSMLEKFRLINPRSASRASPSVAEMSLQEEDDLSEYGEDGFTNLACSSGSSSTANQISTKTPSPSITAPSKTSASSSSSSKANNSGRTGASSKDREDKSSSRSGQKSSKDSSSPKEESSPTDGNKKNSKIASLIPKGGKPSKKDGGNSSSGIPKSGLKAPSSSSCSSSSTSTTAKPQSQMQSQSPALNSSGNLRGGEADRGKMTKGGQGGSFYIQRSSGGSETKRTSLTSSTSTSALSGSIGMLGGGGVGGGALGGNGVVQLPQQQQHNHPNTATVAPFMYRTFSENDCTMMAPAEPCLSPTKGELVYSKTAKQCLEEISALQVVLVDPGGVNMDDKSLMPEKGSRQSPVHKQQRDYRFGGCQPAYRCCCPNNSLSRSMGEMERGKDKEEARGRERRGSRSSTPLLTVVEENKAKKTESRKHEDAKEWEKKVTDVPP